MQWTSSEHISTHAPHTGRDAQKQTAYTAMAQFQSTRPIWGATRHRTWTGSRPLYFNPRAPYGARQISLPLQRRGNLYFNPRAPYGARRPGSAYAARSGRISIHAPHTGRDVALCYSGGTFRFQSTRPIRGATQDARLTAIESKFQSTRPIRGATFNNVQIFGLG